MAVATATGELGTEAAFRKNNTTGPVSGMILAQYVEPTMSRRLCGGNISRSGLGTSRRTEWPRTTGASRTKWEPRTTTCTLVGARVRSGDLRWVLPSDDPEDGVQADAKLRTLACAGVLSPDGLSRRLRLRAHRLPRLTSSWRVVPRHRAMHWRDESPLHGPADHWGRAPARAGHG